MRGIDLIGADEGGLIDAGGALAKGVVSLVKKKPDQPAVPGASTAAPEEEGALSKPLVGPVKIWHAIVGFFVAVGGVVLWRRRK